MNMILKSAAIISSKIIVLGAVFASLFVSTLAHAEHRLNFQDPVTEVAQDIFDLHMLIFWVCVVIFVAVFSVMFYSIFAHRKSKNFEPSQFSHSTKVEIVWTIIPFFILVAMAIPATKVLIDMEDTTKSDLTIKITGYQWKWGYEYLDSEVSFYSTLSTPRAQIDQFDTENAEELGENYLLEVDNHLVVPSGRKVRALITSNDVIHAWWMPVFGVKKDAIPGYINELWFNVEVGKEGTYRGQCAELCGKDHAFMPIVVDVVTGEQFDQWLASGGVSYDATLSEAVEANREIAEGTAEPLVIEEAPAPVSSKTWTKEQLMSKGEEVASQCEVCHKTTGEGDPGLFPAITGSSVATGTIDAHIETVMFGRAGTSMQAFAGLLNDEELAAVITYQRNSYGNNTGDVVLPSDIKSKRN